MPKYNVALCDFDGEVEFLQISNGGPQMLSGILEAYDERHLAWIDRELAANGGQKKVIKCKAARFETIMQNHPEIGRIDYLSIDVEGGEMKILGAIDFSRFDIRLIGIEDAYPDSSGIREFLAQKGYREIAALGCDRFFEKVG